MHGDHEVFVWGIERKRRLRITYLHGKLGEKLIRRCGPLYYSRGRTVTDGQECYYVWDFEAEAGYNFLALSPAQILTMERTEDAFSVEEVSSLSKRSDRSK